MTKALWFYVSSVGALNLKLQLLKFNDISDDYAHVKPNKKPKTQVCWYIMPCRYLSVDLA